MSLENLLDSTLDDLADMPSIKPFPNGAHKVKLGFKVDLAKQFVTVKMTYIEVAELAEPTDVAPAKDDVNMLFLRLKNKDGSANEFNQGALKMICQVLQPTFGGGSVKEVCEKSEGAEVFVVTKIKKGNEGYPDQTQVTEMKVA